MQDKKILVFIDWFLPGYKAGGPIRSVANIVSHLSENYKFYIITTDTDYLESKPYSSVKSNQWVNFNKYTKVYYFSGNKLNKKNLGKLIKDTKFDIAYINGIYSYYFSILPLFLLRKLKNKKVIIAPRGMLSNQSFSAKSLKKRAFLFSAKLFNLYKNISFQATNKEEQESILKEIPKAGKIIIAPNLPKRIEISDNPKRIKEDGLLKMVSIARISPEKNTLFALEILSKSEYSGKIEFDLYGSIYNETYWEKCKKIIQNLSDNITVSNKGSIDSKIVHQTFCRF